jgi:death-on-curing protein
MNRPEPIWIRDDVVLAIHARQTAEHGGGEDVRDANLLMSALGRPKNLWACGEPKPDIAALAAAYAFGIARNRAFVDGNKRTALVVGRTLLLLNGFDLRASQEEKYVAFLKLAEGRTGEDEVAEWIRVRLTGNPSR